MLVVSFMRQPNTETRAATIAAALAAMEKAGGQFNASLRELDMAFVHEQVRQDEEAERSELEREAAERRRRRQGPKRPKLGHSTGLEPNRKIHPATAKPPAAEGQSGSSSSSAATTAQQGAVSDLGTLAATASDSGDGSESGSAGFAFSFG